MNTSGFLLVTKTCADRFETNVDREIHKALSTTAVRRELDAGEFRIDKNRGGLRGTVNDDLTNVRVTAALMIGQHRYLYHPGLDWIRSGVARGHDHPTGRLVDFERSQFHQIVMVDAGANRNPRTHRKDRECTKRHRSIYFCGV